MLLVWQAKDLMTLAGFSADRTLEAVTSPLLRKSIVAMLTTVTTNPDRDAWPEALAQVRHLRDGGSCGYREVKSVNSSQSGTSSQEPRLSKHSKHDLISEYTSVSSDPSIGPSRWPRLAGPAGAECAVMCLCVSAGAPEAEGAAPGGLGPRVPDQGRLQVRAGARVHGQYYV